MRHTLRPLPLLLVLGNLSLLLAADSEPDAALTPAAQAVAAFTHFAKQPEPAGGSVPLPAGLSDAGRRTGFFSNAAGGIDAVDLTTGELLWRNNEAGRPLLIDGQRLYARAGTRRNRLRVLAFDLARRGECVFESDPVVFPGWVVTGEAPGRSFHGRWRLEGGRLLLDWEAEAWSAGGDRSPGLAFPLHKHAAGLVRIDLDGGPVEMLPAAKTLAPANGPPRTPEAVAAHLEKRAIRWTGQVGPYFLAVELAEVSPAEDLRRPAEATKEKGPAPKPKSRKPEYRLVLWGWEASSGLVVQGRELLRGRRPVVQPTLDGRGLCVRDALPSPDEMVASQVRANGGWSLYSALGKPLGTIPYQPGTESLAVVGKHAYALVAGPVSGPLDRPTERPRTLRAIDLKSGKTVWEWPVAPRPLLPPG